MRISDWSSDVCSSDLVEVDEFRSSWCVVAGARLRGGGLDQAARRRQLADGDRGEQQSVVGWHDVPRQDVAASDGQAPAVAFVSTRCESYLMIVQVPGSPPSSLHCPGVSCFVVPFTPPTQQGPNRWTGDVRRMSSAGGRATRGGCRASVVGVDAGSPAGGLLTSGSGYSGSGDVGGDRRRSSSSSSSSVASWIALPRMMAPRMPSAVLAPLLIFFFSFSGGVLK